MKGSKKNMRSWQPPSIKQVKHWLWVAMSIVVGNALLAFSVAAFVIPHELIMGGTTGIGLILARVVPWEPALLILILNLLLLLAGWIVLGHSFFLTTIASSVLYPMFLAGIQRIPNIDSLTDDRLLAALFGGVLMGMSIGMVMRVGSSTGGTDVLNLMLHKWFHWPVAVFVYITDCLVVGGQALLFGVEPLLLGVLLLVLESFTLDRVMLMGKTQLQLFVVSPQYEAIRQSFMDQLDAGVTMTMIETGRLGHTQKGILCVIPPRKLYDARRLVERLDSSAFITVTKIKEVRGRGFTAER